MGQRVLAKGVEDGEQGSARRIAAWVPPTRLGSPRAAVAEEKIALPPAPPTAAPTEIGIIDPMSISSVWARARLAIVNRGIASTVTPERKLAAATLMRPSASMAGLMMTPPPIPQIGPKVQARKQTRSSVA